MRIGQLAQLNEVAYGSDFLYTTSGLYGFFCLKSIFNDTKVFPARLYGTKEKTDAKIEVFLLRELNQEMRLWDVLVEPARKIRIGNKLFFDESSLRSLSLRSRRTWT